MKTTNYFLLAIIIAFLFSSCSSLSISRKRYSRGLNIDWFSAKEDKQEFAARKDKAKKKTKPSDAADEGIAGQDFAQNEQAAVDLTEVESTEPLRTDMVVAPEAKSEKKPIKPSRIIKKVKQHYNDVKAKASHTLSKGKMPKDTDSDSEVALILLILLAIFIPPLAVFLYYGEINIHFWLSLIFCLLAGGLVGISGLYFGWGVPVIHALLVVLGVFD